MTDETREERWSRVAELLERAAAIPPEARPAFLDEACGTDTRLRSHLELLLAADERAEGFLSTPAQHPLHAALDAALVPDPQAGTRIGDCTIVRRVASGGMGSVYEAIQDQPRRKVALKLVHAGLASSATRQRFAYEAEILGRLRHPHIAQVYAAGTDAEGRAYLAMEFVEGARHLTQYVREHPLEPRALARLFCDVCSGVAHGHEKGVIHRDLKPSNVLVDALGQVKVIDFGVARVLDQDALQLTRTGDIVGTLLYMSPEQLEGDPRAVDVRSDVYALGTLLYELFTGRTPHEIRGLSITEAARRLRDETARPLHELAPHVGTELEWIVAKALEKDRDRRYASVNELAADLERYLANDPVLAGPPSATYRVRKFVRRHRVGVAAAAGFVVLLVGGLIAALVARSNALELRTRAGLAEGLANERATRLSEELTTNREILELQSSWLYSSSLDLAGRDVRLAAVLDRARQALDERESLAPLVEVELRFALARAYHALTLWTPMIEQVERVRSLAAAGAPFDAERLDDLERLECVALATMGERDEALVRVESALATSRGAAHGRWSTVHGAVLVIHYRFAEAESALRAGIGEIERSDPASVEVLLNARLELCRALHLQGKLEEARRESARLLEDARARLTPAHALVVQILQESAEEASSYGDREGAIALYAEVLTETEKRYGPDTDIACSAASDLAVELASAGRCDTAPELARRAADGLARLYGEENEMTELRRVRLGIVLANCGRSEEGIAVLSAVRDARAKRLGPDAPEVTEVLSLLGSLLSGAGRLDEAIEALESAHRGYLAEYGPTSVKTQDCASNLAVAYSNAGRQRDALPLIEDVLLEQMNTLEPLSPDVLISMQIIATTLHKAGEVDEAECWCREHLRRSEQRFGGDDPAAWQVVEGLATILVSDGDADGALPWLQRALHAEAAQGWPDARRACKLGTLLGIAARKAGADALAELAHEDAMRLAIERLPPDSSVYSRTEESYGAFLIAIGRVDEGLAILEGLRDHFAGSPEERQELDRIIAKWNAEPRETAGGPR